MNALLEARGPNAPAAAETVGLDWFRAFHGDHANFVRRLVQRLAGPTVDGDDVVQDVFVVAFRKWPELASARVDPRSWLYGVVLRVLRHEWRKRRLRSLLFLDRSAGPAEDQTPAALLERSETQAQVHRLLGSLSENKRTVFVLRELEGLSGQEIADLLRLPIQTVWNRLFHARKDFLKQLARERLRERREASET